jgi:hypothetical protein
MIVPIFQLGQNQAPREPHIIGQPFLGISPCPFGITENMSLQTRQKTPQLISKRKLAMIRAESGVEMQCAPPELLVSDSNDEMRVSTLCPSEVVARSEIYGFVLSVRRL